MKSKMKFSVVGFMQKLGKGALLILGAAMTVFIIVEYTFTEPYDKAARVWVLGQCTTVCMAMSEYGSTIKSDTPMNIGQTMYLTCYKNKYLGQSCDTKWKTKRSHGPDLTGGH